MNFKRQILKQPLVLGQHKEFYIKGILERVFCLFVINFVIHSIHFMCIKSIVFEDRPKGGHMQCESK